MLLSICIPVGPEYKSLESMLGKLAPELAVLREEGEIIVLDYHHEARSRDAVGHVAAKNAGVYYHNEVLPVIRDRVCRMAKMARGQFIWILGGLEFITPGSLAYVREILHDENLSKNLQALVLNHAKFTTEPGGDFDGPDALMDHISITDAKHFAKGTDLLNYFSLPDLRFTASMVLNRRNLLRTSIATIPDDFRLPTLWGLIQLLANGSAVYAPRLCALSRGPTVEDEVSKLSLTELPELYEAAVKLGLDARRAKMEVGRLSDFAVIELREALARGDAALTDPERISRLHGGTAYYWTHMKPAYLKAKFKKK